MVTFQSHESILYYISKDSKQTNKLACFDLDHTLFKPKRTVFPKDENDWIYFCEYVIDALTEEYNNDFRIIIFSNQSGKSQPEMKMQRIKNFLEATPIPIDIFMALEDDKYRKPNTGMFDFMCQQCNIIDVDYEFSFYIGDAAGRLENWKPKTKKDFSCADRKFAYNLDLKFRTPEEYFFNCYPTDKYFLNCFPFSNYKTLNYQLLSPDDCLVNSNNSEVILYLGYPGCGKSTFAQKHHHDYKIINQDTIKSKSKCMKLFKSYLEKREKVVIDNTNYNPEVRKTFISLAQQYKVPIRCFHFNINKELAMHLNNFRMLTTGIKKVPKVVYNVYDKKIKSPCLEEGFQEIINVNFVPEFLNTEEEKIFDQLS